MPLAEANKLGLAHAAKAYTSGKYYVTGVIVQIVNTQYGNVYIQDEEGNKFYIYGLYSYDGSTRYDAMKPAPGLGDEITVWGQIGTYDGKAAQMQNGWIDEVVACPHNYEVTDSKEATCTENGYITKVCSVCELNTVTETIDALGHNFDHGFCANCGDAFVAGESQTITFDFGANGTASHNDGSDLSNNKAYTENGYTLTLTGVTKVYGSARDAKGNSCLKLGTSKLIGSFSFTVPDEVTEVVIYVAKYKANATTISVNGTKYTLTKSSDNGEYDEIKVDTTVTKTVTFATVASTYRAMINTIEFNVPGEGCEHVYTNDCDANCNICNEEREVQHNAGDAATCTTAQTCTVCGATLVEATGHTWVEATCTAPKTCSVCEATEGDALGHTDGEIVVENNVAAGCETAGSYDNVTYCTVCGDETSRETITVDALGHTDGDIVVENEVDADCENAGSYDNVVYCSVCEAELSRNTITVDALGHTDGAIVVENNVAAGCETAGSYDNVVYCTVCGDETFRETITVDALGHTDGAIVVESEVAADCENAGSYDNVTYCTVCGDETSRETIPVPATGHDWDDATCTAPKTCSVCNATEGEALDHTPGEEATCTTPQTCTECGETLVEALGHVWVNGFCSRPECGISDGHICDYEAVETQPTCEEDGYITYTCAVCKASYTEVSKTALGHDWDNACDTTCNRENCEYTRTITHDYESTVTAPTCTVGGYTTYTCTVCGNTYTADETEATGHATEVEYWTYNNKLYLVPVCGCLTEKVLVDTTDALPVDNEEDLVYLLTHGFNVKLDADINLTKTIDIEGAIVTLDLNGKTLKADWESDGLVEVIHVHDASHLTIIGEGNVISGGKYIAETNSVISCRVYSMLTIKGGNYYSASCGDVIFCETSSIVRIEGGHFEAAEDYLGTWYVLDIDESETTNRGQFVVTGGTFVNFDPANHTNDSDYTNKVADGYHSIKNDNNYVVSAHSYTANVTAPTCTEDGYTTYTCGCGESYVADEVAATGHDYKADVTAPTCTKDGYTTYTCACGDSYVEDEVDALGHTDGETVVENEVAAGCVNAGSYDNVVYCSVCGDELSRETITVDALGHTDGETVVENEVEADCENAGSYDNVVYCSVCGDELSRETITVDALGHTDGETVVENNIAPKCETAGSYDNVVYCTVCNAELSRETVTVDALGHTYVDHEAQEATCTEKGWEAYQTCENCDYTTYVEISANGHTPGDAATCIHDQICTVCEDVLTPATGVHNYWYGTCSECNEAIVFSKIEATISFATTAARQESTTTKQFWTQNGINFTYLKGSYNNNLAEYNNPIRLYADTQITIEFAGMTQIAITCNSASYATTCANSISGATVSGNVVTINFIEARDAFTFSPGAQIRVDSIKVIAEEKCAHSNLEADATCTTAQKCTICGETVVAAKGHTPNENATCTTSQICTTCNTVLVEAFGHAYDNVCDANCNTCNEEREVPEHVYENDACINCGQEKDHVCEFDSEVTLPTCVDKGYTTYTCECGNSYTADETEATGEHNYVDGACSVCGEEDPNAPKVLATFTLGANGSASHADGSSATTYKETVDGYTLSITGGTNMYTGARDAKGNSCIKLGTSSKTGSFSLTVGADVNKVVIYVAQYKANTTKITVNGTSYTITTASNNGAYTAIEIDTTTTKTITFASASGGVRAMVNTIEFWG